EIYIARNRILDMGLNGIGVVGFFNLDDADEFISVNRLTITGNEIRRCLHRPLADTSPEMIDSMGYGGIALADVEYLVVRNNVIEDNGPSQLEPICGVFVLHGEGIDISGNRILNNGARTASTDSAKAGRRGGINIVYAVAPTDFIPIAGMEDELPRQNGVPAAKVHDNIVSVPLGQALSLTALGPVSVVGNQFTSRGVVVDLTSSSFWAATVAIFNLGLSNELGLQLLSFSGARSSGKFGFSNTSAVKGLEITDDEVVLAQEGLDDLLVGQYLANGNVLFSNNQCTLDLLEPGVGLSLTSILIVTLDDVGFHNNQCDSSLLDDFVLSQAILFGFFSVRASDNRFKETLLRALFSAVTMGVMNTTTDNQGTHCFVVLGVLPKAQYPWFVVDQRNTELLDGLIRSVTDDFSWCNRLKGLLGGGSGGEPID
ncbi:MAG: hypothetical protein ACE10K_13770, partial [Rhodothermales bacterium]